MTNNARFAVVASRSGQKRTVGYYADFEAACNAASTMIGQGNGLGFHVKYDILCDEKPFFYVMSDAFGPGEIVELLDEWNMLEGIPQEEKVDYVRQAKKDGKIVATGDAVAIIPDAE
ncbi:MAG: hypothetical protein MJ186_06990 [Clostridia bacterium]|nr:hypothetical protein [Clostridia bacterium]